MSDADARSPRTTGPRRRRLALIGAITAASVGVLATASYGAQFADTTPPQTSVFGPASPTRDNQPTFTLQSTEAGSTFNCSLDFAPFLPCGPDTYRPPQPLGEGQHTLIAYATDPAGNTDPGGSRVDFIVDRSVAGAVLSGARNQRVSPRKLQINLTLAGQEALTVKASGLVVIGAKKLATRSVKKTLGDRTTISPKLTVVSGVERTIARALKRGVRVEVRVTAQFRDQVGNEIRKKRTIVLR